MIKLDLLMTSSEGIMKIRITNDKGSSDYIYELDAALIPNVKKLMIHKPGEALRMLESRCSNYTRV